MVEGMEGRKGLTVVELLGWVIGVDVLALTVFGASKVLLYKVSRG